jgi:hypothetical protein
MMGDLHLQHDISQRFITQQHCSTTVKVKLPTTHHGGTWGERRYSSHWFLTSALGGSVWSVSQPSRALPPCGKDHQYPLHRMMGVPESHLDAEARRKIICPCLGSNPGRPVKSDTILTDLIWLMHYNCIR